MISEEFGESSSVSLVQLHQKRLLDDLVYYLNLLKNVSAFNKGVQFSNNSILARFSR